MSGSSNLESDANKLNELYNKLNNYVDTGVQSRENIKLLMDSYHQFDDTDTYQLNLMNADENTNITINEKQNELTTIENNNIRNQYKELENIKYNIINKNSLIDNTNAAIEETNIQINILSTILFFSFLFLIIIYLYGSNKISSTILLAAFIFILIIYALLLLYYFNIGAFRLFVYNFYNVKEFKFDQRLKGWVDQMDNDLEAIKSEFSENNCNCPKNASIEKNNNITKNNSLNKNKKRINQFSEEEEEYNSKYNTIQNTNYSYFDDSAPAQTVFPFPNSNMGYKIDWIDYDSTNNSNYFYGNENTNLPRSDLSNDVTYTQYM
jgi:uncharacterized MAPEG superfamily protein